MFAVLYMYFISEIIHLALIIISFLYVRLAPFSLMRVADSLFLGSRRPIGSTLSLRSEIEIFFQEFYISHDKFWIRYRDFIIGTYIICIFCMFLEKTMHVRIFFFFLVCALDVVVFCFCCCHLVFFFFYSYYLFVNLSLVTVFILAIFIIIVCKFFFSL